MKILAVEDEESLQKLLRVHFGYENWDVDVVSTGEEALEKLDSQTYDVLVLDWMLAGEMSGLDVCKKIAGRIPILMLTARSSPVDIVLGLESGADDYITKPFDEHILIARIRALHRRASIKSEPKKDSIQIEELEIFPDRFKAKVSGEEVELTTSEFKLLVAIAEGRGSVLSRKSLLDKIQDSDVTVVERIVDTHVYSIRKKLGKAADFIETIRGIGYRVKV